MGALLASALAAVAIMFFLALAGVISVKCLSGCSKKVTALFNAISGGIILGVAWFHMAPENIEAVEPWGKSIQNFFTGDDSEAFPIGFLFLGLGFWLMVSIEQCCVGSHSHDIGGSHEDHDDEDEEEEDEDEDEEVDQRTVVTFTKTVGSSLGGLGTLFGLCLHAFLEAIAIGAQTDAGSMAVLILATGFHKFSAAFAVG